MKSRVVELLWKIGCSLICLGVIGVLTFPSHFLFATGFKNGQMNVPIFVGFATLLVAVLVSSNVRNIRNLLFESGAGLLVMGTIGQTTFPTLFVFNPSAFGGKINITLFSAFCMVLLSGILGAVEKLKTQKHQDSV